MTPPARSALVFAVLLALLGGGVLLLLPRISPDREVGRGEKTLREAPSPPAGSAAWGARGGTAGPTAGGDLEGEVSEEAAAGPAEGEAGLRPPREARDGAESEAIGEGGKRTRTRSRLLDPAFHEQVLRDLPEQQTVSYLAIRVRQLASDTLRQFPRSYPEERLAARRLVEYLNGRVSARKREAASDPEAFETLRQDLLRLDRSLEEWRDRVLAGEPALPEIDL